MNRVRVSTTVDAHFLGRARRLLPLADGRLLDRALVALVQQLEEVRESAVLTAQPYEDDPELAWLAPDGPDLPYDGEIPREVVELSRRRRRRQS